ncbi:type I polyketide synthase [Aspergillus fischeri NRRL 181]|uniref:Polyketide synthase, putative n=1 Tax=Neosartorya fischeri (strain ATCC 1020 / DSM 3700 / CBS 544.65 / FGSC A1164 / JCM 1740 / NRRL 181 / WB 181) TaxID=331117 RepID=A1DK13_NEOFI|nr:polyketide synthase, putative [Aspergillus fischeri NRRL 181]EAW17052.1 polyketide synthase, putative [Aspergillus fischeri NRRL 181]
MTSSTAEAASVKAGAPSPIAIVGMGMRLPGGVRTADDFWDVLIDQKDCSSEVPKTRYNIDAFYDPDKPQSVRTRRGYFLEDDYLEKADTNFLQWIPGFNTSELDPQQRLLFEVIWECMENAGQTGWRGKDIGCYVGVFGEDWHELTAKESQVIPRTHVFANGGFALSNRVSYEFDLKGPSLTIATACSSSLSALHEACQALQTGSCSSAIVAGTNMLLTPSMSVTMSENMVLSPDGLCKTFDADANGYARGEAVNAVYIKTLDKAIADGDPIRAVIRATSANYDGRTAKIFAPDIAGQERLIRKAYERAQIDNIAETAFVECHGTGTRRGDIVEATAIAQTFHPHGVHIGSVKTNFGHGEGASGLTAVIKAVLALEHRTIPPNMHFRQPNPSIPFQEARLKVPVEPTPWPENRKERVSVNGFGVGGANAHAILESASSIVSVEPKQESRRGLAPRLVVCSAHSKTALDARVDAIRSYLALRPQALADVAYTLGVRRDHLSHRSFTIVNSDGEILGGEVQSCHLSDTSLPLSLVFTFSGQGAQWDGMGVDLIRTFPSFQRDIQFMDQILQQLQSPPAWSIEDQLGKPPGLSQIDIPEISQTLSAAIQIALVNLFKDWGISPSAVVGHSSGEVIAAYAANAVSLRTAIILAYLRGQCVSNAPSSGGMVAVGMDEVSVKPYLSEGVVVACENSPQSVNLSGDKTRLASVVDRIKADKPETFIRYVPVPVAYHSSDMRPAAALLESQVAPFLQHNDSMLPMYSTVTGKVISDPAALDAEHWRKNLELPVLFSTAVASVLAESPERRKIFLEIGSHSILSGPLRQIFTYKSSDCVYLPTLIKSESETFCLLKTAGQLYLHGHSVDFQAVNGKGDIVTNLPAYPWDRKSLNWQESRLSRNWRFRAHPNHELLGSRILEASDLEPGWRNVLETRNVPWLLDHRVSGEVVFPCAGYIAMIHEAMRQLSNNNECTIQNLSMQVPLILPRSEPIELLTTARHIRVNDRVESEWHEFAIMSYNGTEWIRHAFGRAKSGVNKVDSELRGPQDFPRRVSSELWYRTLEKVGLSYGPTFRGLQDITADPSTCVAAASMRSCQDGKAVHPTVIDECLQLFTVAACKGRAVHMTRLYVPMFVGEVQLGLGQETMRAEATISNRTAELGNGNVRLTAMDQQDASIKQVLSMADVTVAPLDSNMRAVNEADIPLASHAEWRPDIDLLNEQKLPRHYSQSTEAGFALIAKLSALSIIQVHRRIADVTPFSPSLEQYQKFISTQIAEIQRESFCGVPEAASWLKFSEETLQRQRASLDEELRTSKLAFASSLSNWVLETVRDIADGSLPPSAFPAAVQEQIWQCESLVALMTDVSDWFGLLRHSNPLLRILHIAEGKGVVSHQVLEHLNSEDLPFYSEYTYTSTKDIGSAVHERLKEFKAVNFKNLDMTTDPCQQGFEKGAYDLVIVSNTNVPPSQLQTALQNIKRLLVPGGRVLLHIPNAVLPIMGYIRGLIIGEEVESCGVSPCRNQWKETLLQVGLDQIQGTYGEHPYCNLSARLPHPIEDHTEPIHLLCPALVHNNAWICNVEAQFERMGYQTQRCTLAADFTNKQRIVSLLDVQKPFFKDISETSWKSFRSLVTATPRILWVMPSVELTCQNPDFAIALGVSRTARQEQELHFGTLQIDEFHASAAAALVKVTERFFSQLDCQTGLRDPEYEFALQGGQVYIPRFQWTRLEDRICREPLPNASVKIDIKAYGSMESLCWCEDEPQPLGPDDVEVDIKYVGLNFRDIMISMGFLGHKGQLGIEASGIIRQCGKNIAQLHPGDRVIVAQPGLFRTRAIVPSSRCVSISPSMSLEEGASLAVVFGTALYCLMDIARLEKGQSVLIHAACGGVGLAAIQVCQMIGAEIYATAGSEAKADYLVHNMGIPRQRIFNSRDGSFLPALMGVTQGRGVDVVLNSLAGELLHASWKCVAEFGKMIEIGKRDFLEHGKLDMEAFGGNRAFFGVDLIRLGEKPGLVSRLVAQAMALYEEGRITPVRPLEVVEASDIHRAFRLMQLGHHMGKMVVKMPERPREVVISKSRLKVALPDDVSYLLVGGLGGVGRALATMMVERGARHFVFLSRSAGKSAQDQAFRCELEAQGCSAVMIQGDVGVLDDVKAAIQRSSQPIGGVLQLSMVLRDHFIPDMAHSDWKEGLSAKVAGTWNLHEALKGHDNRLQFFVVCGSVTGVMGNAGQVNYSSANAFLTSFAQYRLRAGLPAAVVNLGGVGDVGHLAVQDQKLRDRMYAGHVRLLSEQEVLDAFEIAMLECQPLSMPANESSDGILRVRNDVIVGMSSTKSLGDPSVRPLWGRDARFSVYANLDINRRPLSKNLEAVEGLQQELAACEKNPDRLKDPALPKRIMREVVRSIQEYSNFARGQDYAQVAALPIDSLMTVEFRNWSRRYFNMNLPLTAIAKAGTVEGFAELVFDSFRSKYLKQ